MQNRFQSICAGGYQFRFFLLSEAGFSKQKPGFAIDAIMVSHADFKVARNASQVRYRFTSGLAR